MAAYLGYSLRMKTLFHGWPVMVNDMHTRRRRRLWLRWDKCAKLNQTPSNQMKHNYLLPNYIHIIYVIMYTSCLVVKSLHQSVTGQCGRRMGGWFIVWLLTPQDNECSPQMCVCPVVNTVTGQANGRLTGINWPVCPVVPSSCHFLVLPYLHAYCLSLAVGHVKADSQYIRGIINFWN